MKKILKIAAPFILILAAFASYYVKVDSRMVFSDTAGHWAAEEIEKWSSRGIINGSEGKFRPDDSLSLAELATIYTRILPLDGMAENTFEDVPDGEWFTEPVLMCVDAGIIDAAGKTELHPREPVTRVEAYMMLVRAFGIEGVEGDELPRTYNDAKRLTTEQKPYFEALLSLGLISGQNKVQLYPGEFLSRAETVDMLERLERGGYIAF